MIAAMSLAHSVRMSSWSRSIASVCSDTCTETMRPGVRAADRDVLAADGDHAGRADPALHGDGLGSGSWRRAGGARASQPEDFGAGELVGAAAQQLARDGVEEQQGLGFDADRDLPAAEDPRPR